jgi:hypothetical protein
MELRWEPRAGRRGPGEIDEESSLFKFPHILFEVSGETLESFEINLENGSKEES